MHESLKHKNMLQVPEARWALTIFAQIAWLVYGFKIGSLANITSSAFVGGSLAVFYVLVLLFVRKNILRPVALVLVMIAEFWLARFFNSWILGGICMSIQLFGSLSILSLLVIFVSSLPRFFRLVCRFLPISLGIFGFRSLIIHSPTNSSTFRNAHCATALSASTRDLS